MLFIRKEKKRKEAGGKKIGGRGKRKVGIENVSLKSMGVLRSWEKLF